MRTFNLFMIILFLCFPAVSNAFDIHNRTENPITIRINGTCSTTLWGKRGLFNENSHTNFVYDEIKEACHKNQTSCTFDIFDSTNCNRFPTLTLTVDVERGVMKSQKTHDNEWPHNAAWHNFDFLMVTSIS